MANRAIRRRAQGGLSHDAGEAHTGCQCSQVLSERYMASRELANRSGEMVASGGDDGNVLLWVPSEQQTHGTTSFGEEDLEDKETWRLKHMCRSSGSEIYDLAWSPDGAFFITGSMDNIARIYSAQNGKLKLLSKLTVRATYAADWRT